MREGNARSLQNTGRGDRGTLGKKSGVSVIVQFNQQHSVVASSPLPSGSATSFRTSPLIWLTLLALYVALLTPLPFLAQIAGAPIPPFALWLGIVVGGVMLYAALSERVVLDEQSIQVTYPVWVPHFFRRGWCLPWSSIQALKPRSTGQGGLVYYFLSTDGKAYLLPMRVAGFARLVQQVQTHTGIDTTDVRPLPQPWMYVTLLGLTLLLLLVDGWTIWIVVTSHGLS